MPPESFDVTVQVSRKLVESCLDSGISVARQRWLAGIVMDGSRVRSVPDDFTVLAPAQVACRGGVLQLRTRDQAFRAAGQTEDDPDAKVPALIDTVAIERGLHILAGRYPFQFAKFVNGEADGETGDALLQCAAFGEIVFVV